MDDKLLYYYEQELTFIRQMGVEFAKKYPKIAGRLLLEPDKCDDLSWFSLDQLPDNMIPYVKHAIECFRERIIYSEFGWIRYLGKGPSPSSTLPPEANPRG